MVESRLTERSYYPVLKECINSLGGKGVSEVAFNSVPDLIFEFSGYQWILSVKIGESIGTIKDAVLQYLRHKEESGIKFGMLLMLPESARSVKVDEDVLLSFVKSAGVTALIDAGEIKTELRDRAFPEILRFIKKDVIERLTKKESAYFSLNLVVSLLQQLVTEMMDQISLSEEKILQIVTNKHLLMNLAHLKPDQAESVGRFLASYILMSQTLFLRLFYTEHAKLFTDPIRPASKHSLRKAFKVIENINYKPIFAVDVLDVTPDKFVADTVDLIWGMQIEKAREELPGRVFHELMPMSIRKMLAAFYTRPIAADLLAAITICDSNETVFDPASGSGTILVSAYRRKAELHKLEGKVGSPHKRFCEEEIFGADIMPFAVHLTEANLAAMEVGTTIERTQIIQGDTLKLVAGKTYPGGIMQLDIFPQYSQDSPKARKSTGETYSVSLGRVDTILMNPPFTKVERGIAKLVDMKRFASCCGGEVGLWGHFIAFAEEFLKKGGTFGGVIPINLLRGRESHRVREQLFNEWTPLYIVKTTFNYAFSEWSEYRDILVIARREKPRAKQKIKFCLVKKDLLKADHNDISMIAESIMGKNKVRSALVDIDSHPLEDVRSRFSNMMWYCGVTDLKHRDVIVDFVKRFPDTLGDFPTGYFKEGFRPVPEGVSQFLFLTRRLNDERVKAAFLRFEKEGTSSIEASGPLGGSFDIEKSALMKTLRTPIGLSAMDISKSIDYITFRPPQRFDAIKRAVGFKPRAGFSWPAFWLNMDRELKHKQTQLVVLHRVNPFAPSTSLLSLYSEEKMSPSNQLNMVMENDEDRAKAMCVLFNSIQFLVQFFLLKEESTGRYINVRFYDLAATHMYPSHHVVPQLRKVFDHYRSKDFPSLRQQFDRNFELRYKEFWDRQKSEGYQGKIWSVIDSGVEPSDIRLEFDLSVCNALDMKVSRDDLLTLYEVIVKEMIMTRHLTRD
jgi:hypothetical protein